MLLVARKNLFAERVRLAISVGGVALSVFLIGVLLSLFRGWNQQVGGFVEKTPADLWVASDGTTDFLAASSALPGALGGKLKFVPDVEVVSPLIVRPMELYKSGNDPKDTFDVQLVGFDPVIGLGGPIKIEGNSKAKPGPGDIIIDKETSRRYHVNIGDRVIKGTKALNVAGIASGGDFVYTQVAFVTLDTAVQFLDLEPVTMRTFYLLTLKNPKDAPLLAHRLEVATPGAKYILPGDFANETRSRILGNILPILIVVLVLAFIVGLSVAGLTIYTATVEKSREYGILKAEGFTNPFLYRVVFEQSLITGSLGFLIGAGLTLLVAPFAQNTVPQFVVFVRWQDILGVAGITLVMALIAAYIPVRRIASIDPVTVFKG